MSALSYAKGPDTPLAELTLAQALARTAARFPEREALVSCHQGVRYTWRELDEAVTRVARGLGGLGLRLNDRVGIWSTNCAEWLVLQYACARAGVVLVNVNPAYRSWELSYVLGKSGIRALFLWESDARSNYRQILEESRSPEHALEHVVYFGDGRWRAMLESNAELPGDPVLATDVTNIQYTSGTTGSPKGVLLTHRNLVNNGFAVGECTGLTERDRMVIAFPLYHCAGLVCCAVNSVTHGAAIVLASAAFDARAVLEAVDGEKATVITGVPTMFVAELQHPEFASFDLTSLHTALIGGAPCPVELLKRMNKELHCEQVTVAYGQTEASPLITMHSTGDTQDQRSSTVGRPAPNTEVKIVNPGTGETVRLGESGELCTRGYHVMAGYDRDPEATARAIDAEGWLHTGDLAIMREDGHFHIRGRAKEMIIRGGENIYPAEVESFLFSHPKVGEAHVVGLPDRKLGEIVAAWIRPKPGETLTAEEVREYCKGRLSHFKIPQHIRMVDSFPMTVTGKVQKFRIRETEIETLGLAGEVAATA